MRAGIHPLLASTLLLAFACAGSRPVPVPKAARLCGPEISGASEILVPRGTVLLGEMHGTSEIPYVVSELACEASSRGLPVAVAVELAASEQARIDAFLASAGTDEDRQRLLNGRFWHRPYQDGRSSRAILALLDRLRALRAAGAGIRAVAYDAPDYEHNPHEEVMASTLLADRGAHPEDLLLVLCGNVHARTVQGVEWDPTLLPMGARLREKLPGLVSLDSDWAPGAAWTCRLTQPIDCGAVTIGAPRRQPLTPLMHVPPLFNGWTPALEASLQNDASFVEPAGTAPPGFRGYRPYVRLSKRSPEGYDGVFYVGPLTASPPAATASLGVE